MERKELLFQIDKLLPDDITAFDSATELNDEIKDKRQLTIVDVNGYLMGVNWCKDFIKEQLTKKPIHLQARREDGLIKMDN